MGDEDYCRTQRDVGGTSAAIELVAHGFEDVTEIGRGGFGTVFRCRQPDLGRVVAVKVLTFGDETGFHPALSEQLAMGRLTGHPNIVDIFDLSRTRSGRAFIVMPYFACGSLDALIRERGLLSLEDSLRIGIKLASAVGTAHRIGIVHCDIKPANVLVSDYGEPVLADFGIARIAGHSDGEVGAVVGSPAFLAPELFSGVMPTPESDVYGLAATVFCALTGRAAYERRSGETLADQVKRVLSQPAPDPRNSGIPADVSTVVQTAMSRSRSERPSALLFGEQLQRLQARHGFPVDEIALFAGRERALTGVARRPIQPGEQRSSPATIEGNLPSELNSFVDRRKEVGETRNLLGHARLVTLTGVGGVGKTRLALRIGQKVRSGFPDGVWMVDLSELRDGSLVSEIVAETLKLRTQPTQTPVDALLNRLNSSRTLLILDNCEHLLHAVAVLVDTLLRRCPELRILATSREAIGVDGEAIQQVLPLPVPDVESGGTGGVVPKYDAVSLFIERASAVSGLEVTTEQYETVARICTELDGLPLAIELAAARSNSMSVDQILERLPHRYALLTRGRRGAPERQQTLRSAIDWSHDLCSEQEQQTWARMSVFAGSFGLDTAEDALEGQLNPAEVLDVISSLVDKSILLKEDVGQVVRFRMLDTIRTYGLERLEGSGEKPLWYRRHRDWYARLAIDANSAWIAGQQRDSHNRLARELVNIRCSLSYGLTDPGDISTLRVVNALFRFWLARGMLTEGRYWLDRALLSANESECQREDLLAALCADTTLASLQGDLETARSLVARARSLDVGTQEPAIHGYALHAEGFLSLFTGESTKAQRLLEKALQVFGDLHDTSAQFEVLVKLGWAYALADDFVSAEAHFEKARSITETHGEEVYQSYALRGIGFALWRLGDPEGADQALIQGLKLARLRDDPFEAALCMESMAWVVCDEGDPARAATLMASAKSLVQQAGSTTVAFPSLLPYHDACARAVMSALSPSTVEAIHKRASWCDLASASAYALNEMRETQSTGSKQLAGLTKREYEVAELVSEGLTNKAIAGKLVISLRTVGGHVEHILTKLGFTSRAQVAAWMAIRRQSGSR
ncbi:protein kinase domain-containing protein [Rhodococcus globerulus]|uniref:protein kinase domain-containing protein n=1 Tax=Rhodococcus globerulus TaxID=33008 RepID=UPI001C583B48|nr:protein kinase [Rhodococcus globerulus]QXW01344.1 protein kinase [Rhodococcus globerulus]